MKAPLAILSFVAIPLVMSGEGPWRNIGDTYRLNSEGLEVVVDAAKSGRVMELNYKGVPLLTSSDADSRFYGSTLWISPQESFWPEDAVFDSVEYAAKVDGVMLVLDSPVCKNGLKVMKEYHLLDGVPGLSIRYTLTNTSDTLLSFAPWSVLRVPPGVTYFPADGNEINTSDGAENFAVTGNSCVWMDQTAIDSEKAWKIFSQGRNGWIAHKHDSVMLVICYPDIESEEVPPGQGEVEVFGSPGCRYVELETHGQYKSVKPGGNMTYNMLWIATPCLTIKQ